MASSMDYMWRGVIKVGYSVEVSGSDAMNVFWEVIEDHIFKESK